MCCKDSRLMLSTHTIHASMLIAFPWGEGDAMGTSEVGKTTELFMVHSRHAKLSVY